MGQKKKKTDFFYHQYLEVVFMNYLPFNIPTIPPQATVSKQTNKQITTRTTKNKTKKPKQDMLFRGFLKNIIETQSFKTESYTFLHL